MSSATREELYTSLATIGLMGSVKEGKLDGALGEAGGEAYVLPAATTTVIGGVLKAAPVVNQEALTVTSIEEAQTAITALVTKINAILASQRTAGQI